MKPLRIRAAAAVLLAALAAPALAHHGSAAIGSLAVDGPGSAFDTASPMPMGRGSASLSLKSEYVPYQQLPGLADLKRYSLYDTATLGVGITPWLSGFVFQPYNVKQQDGIGTNHGLGDTNLMLSSSFKWDEGFRLVPEKESLDDLLDWHFGLWVSCTIPVGPTTHVDDHGDYYAADMQTGFRGPSPAAGLSVLKQLSADFTVLGEVNYQKFFEQDYTQAGYRYQFGAETRVNTALVWRAWAGGTRRVDLSVEAGWLNLQRDKTDGAANLASGGNVLYGELGARAMFGNLSIGADVKVPVAKSLNEQAQQQGSEGLEDFRASLVLGWSARL
jgi:hypothetical protein